MRPIIITILMLAVFITPVSASLIAYYPFDGNAGDHSGNGNDGQNFGGKFVDGIKGKGIYLSGMGDYIQVRDSPYFHDLNELSITVWINTQKAPGTIVSKEFNGVYTGFELRIDPEGQVEFMVGREQAYSPLGIASRKKVDDGKWHHIAVVYRGDVLRIYIDGKLDSSSTSTHYTKLDNTRPLVIGKTLYSGGRDFKGTIDELKIYNHGLTLNEIQKDYTITIPEKKNTPKKTQTPVSTPSPASSSTSKTNPGNENPLPLNLNPDDYRILLDFRVEKIGDVVIGGKVYAVYRYKNLLPYASRIEILSRDGLIENMDTAEDVLRLQAWKDASKMITPGDIETIRNIGELSQKMVNVLSPVESILSAVLGEINRMKNVCMDIGIARKCAWDLITAAYPEMSSLENSLRKLDNEIGEWLSASSMVSKKAPAVAEGLESVKAGNQPPGTLQGDIYSLISAFMTLEGKTSELSSSLGSVSNNLISAGKSIISKSNIPVIGNVIGQFGEFLVDKGNSIGQVKRNIDNLSSEMRQLSEKLSSVRNEAQKRSDQLMSEWKRGRSAEMKVYGTLGGIPALIFGILAVRRWRRSSLEKTGRGKKGSALPGDVRELNKITEMISNLERAKESGEVDNEVYMELREEYERKRRAVIKKVEENLKRSLKEFEILSKESDKISRELLKLKGRFSAGEINRKKYERRKREIEKVLNEKERRKKFIEDSINHRTQVLKEYSKKNESE